MQNRRIIDSRLREAGVEPQPTLESNSMMVLFSHVRTGRWASVMPAVLAETLGLADADPLHPDRRSPPAAGGRPGLPAARADGAADRGAGDRGAPARPGDGGRDDDRVVLSQHKPHRLADGGSIPSSSDNEPVSFREEAP